MFYTHMGLISIKLKNRKEFEVELFKLLDSIILAPDFLNDITNKEIDDDFIDKIKSFANTKRNSRKSEIYTEFASNLAEVLKEKIVL